MQRYAIMVDAGYLLRQSIEIVSAKASTSRSALTITDSAGLVKAIIDKACTTLSLGGKELLRVYWYDGVGPHGFTPQQRALVEVDDVQFRAGTINGRGQQKGVDSLIVTDLIELASHHAISDAVLVTGDSDLAVGIGIAQSRGLRIAVIGVEDLTAGVAHNQSFEITSRADRIGFLGGAELGAVLRYAVPAVSAPSAPTPTSAGSASTAPIITTRPASPVGGTDQALIARAVEAFVAAQGTSLQGCVDQTTGRIDSAVDRTLLHHVYTTLARGKLTEPEKIFVRQVFRGRV